MISRFDSRRANFNVAIIFPTEQKADAMSLSSPDACDLVYDGACQSPHPSAMTW